MSTARAPVGVFDSGVGGLTVLHALRRLLPAEDWVYYADRAHCPYGGQPPERIQARANEITDELLGAGCKLVVVACNTATIAAIAGLRAGYALPFVGMEPAVKPACAMSRSGVVGVMATGPALDGGKFQALVATHAGQVRVVTQACPGLVDCIESGELEGPRAEALVARYLDPLLAAGADVVVLGCTHYPYLRPLIERRAGSGVQVLDTGAAVARRVQALLGQSGLLRDTGEQGVVHWRGSGRTDDLEGWLARVPAP